MAASIQQMELSAELFKESPTKTYELGLGCTETACGPWIRCLTCNSKSFHPMDIEQRFCSFCKQYHAEDVN